MRHLTRRSVLRSAAGLLPALALPAANDRAAAHRLTEVQLDLDRLRKWDDSNGDTWDPFWADDGNLYAFHCDGRGFGKLPRNLAFDRLSGDSVETLAGSIVNSMDEYGKAGQKESDNATWKACGQECIDGVFYAFVSRNTYGSDSGDYWLRQTAVNSSLIKSTDRGRTWTRSAADNYAHPMWPGPHFGAPFFVHYGQNGGQVKQDDAQRWVYALSTSGFWNDGDSYTLGRVERSRISALNPTDWTYYRGGDGLAASSWTSDPGGSHPVFEARVHCGQSGPCFISALGLYLMVVWYNPDRMVKWFEPAEMRYEFYQAPHPWGPWSFVSGYSDRFLAAGHMYGPSLCAKFQRAVAGDVHVTMFTAGCPFEDQPSGLYKAWSIPLILKTAPPPQAARIAAGDPRIVYSGAWGETAAAAAELAFTGIGVDVIADKQSGFGALDIFVDGTLVHTALLAVTNLPHLSGVTVFRSAVLKSGAHRIRVAAKSAAPVVLDAFQVYTRA